ncbi:MAG: CxxxxCH/CxxCH domain-containing protein [Thermodesulfobacteriota bacterium]
MTKTMRNRNPFGRSREGAVAVLVVLLWVSNAQAAHEVTGYTAAIPVSTLVQLTTDLDVYWNAPVDMGGDTLVGYVYQWNRSSATATNLDRNTYTVHGGFVDAAGGFALATLSAAAFINDDGGGAGDFWYLHLRTEYLDSNLIPQYSADLNLGPFFIDNVVAGTIGVVDPATGQPLTQTWGATVSVQVGAPVDMTALYLSDTPVRPETATSLAGNGIVSIPLTDTTAGEKTLYAWFTDAAGNSTTSPVSATFNLVECLVNADCGTTAFCDSAPNTCGGGGVCKPLPESCVALWAPACGCDGRSYGNDCEAARAGVAVDTSGQSCQVACTDGDGDGYAPQGGVCGAADCDDTDPQVHPGGVEICGDGIDQDCSGADLATPPLHDATNAIVCQDCHSGAGGQPVDTACEVCHNNASGDNYDKGNAPAAGGDYHPHTTGFSTTNFAQMACWDCHRIHQEPTAPPLVTGHFTSWLNLGGESLLTFTDYTVFDERGGQVNNCADPGSDTWCDPAEWMQKTATQSPYDPLLDRNSPAFVGGPCDPGPDNIPGTGDDAYDLMYNCSMGVAPGERGLILWVTFDSGRRGSFEINYADADQIVVQGALPAGETLTASPSSPAGFELRYGMLVRTNIEGIGSCSPSPQGTFCYDAILGTYNETCTADSDCRTGRTCRPTSYPQRCRQDADCPAGGTCSPSTVSVADELVGPRNLAYNENSSPVTYAAFGADPTPTGICQICHTATNHWRADGSGADHNNGMICTSCHSHEKWPTGCLSCHGNPSQTGNHGKHSSPAGYRYDCRECHKGGDLDFPDLILGGDGRLQIGFNNLGVKNEGANLTGEGTVYHPPADNGIFYQGTNGTLLQPTVVTDLNFQTCGNVYCHSQAKRQVQGFDLPSTSNPWGAADSDLQGDNFKCNNCHGWPPTFDSHRSHHVRNFSCELCHADTAANATTLLPDKRRHANGVYDVVGASFFYGRRAWHTLNFTYTPPAEPPGSGTCSNNSCHQFYRFKDPCEWRNRPQAITKAELRYTQAGSCQAGATSGGVAVEVTVDCSDCLGPYTCDFDWGDGTASTNVNCTTSHTYADKVPNGTQYDPASRAIGGFPVTFAVRDSYGVSLAEGARSVYVQVCPYPNVGPVANFNLMPGPDPARYDSCLVDLSVDADYNVGTHYDPTSPQTNYGAPGAIRIEWGGYAADGSGKGMTEAPINLSSSPSNATFCFTYDRSGYYYVRHAIMDNAGQWVHSPVRVFRVSR